jgi:hypothetical protein
MALTAARHPSDTDSRPPQFGHPLGQTPVGARPPIALWDLEHVQRTLGGRSVDAVIADLTEQTFSAGLLRRTDPH